VAGRGLLYGKRAVERVNKMQYAEALADYDETIRLHPRFAIAYVARGTVHDYTGDNERAIADYTKAIQLRPNSAPVYNARGNACRDKGDYQRALADYTEAIKRDATLVYAYDNRGLTYFKLEQFDKAVACQGEGWRHRRQQRRCRGGEENPAHYCRGFRPLGRGAIRQH
jgi:tetratricopeptide (TPR) repeat protein